MSEYVEIHTDIIYIYIYIYNTIRGKMDNENIKRMLELLCNEAGERIRLYTNGVYTKGTRAHTQKELVRGGA